MKAYISFVIPVYNEEQSVSPLYNEIEEATIDLIREKKISDYEIIFVNDGSTDKTQENLESLKSKAGKRLKVIEFRKNFGKAEAYKAGFKLCSGDLVLTMDGDLQDNPQNLPNFIDKINQGYDIVIGWKHKRKDLASRKILSKIFNTLLRHSTKLSLHDFDNGYRCMKKEILPHLDLYEGLYRYIPVFAGSKGFKVGEVKVDHRERKFGKSKYGFSRIFRGFFDLINIKFLFDYSKRPLHFFGGVGSFFFAVGFFIAIYLSCLRIFLNETIGNRPLLTLSMLLMIIGIQFLLFGLLGEMIANISKKEENYSIKKIS